MTAPPPQPDPETGEPRPPRAPSVVGPWAGHGHRGRRVQSWAPADPQHFSDDLLPALELVEARRGRPLRTVAAYSAGIALVLGIGLALVAAGSADLRGDPVPYLICALVWVGSTAAALLARRTHTVYAGARWAGDATDRDTSVSTYDLARITVFGGSGPAAMLQLIAPNGDFLQLPLGLLEGNPALWDLVYNGIRHSAAGGAEVEPETRALLKLR